MCPLDRLVHAPSAGFLFHYYMFFFLIFACHWNGPGEFAEQNIEHSQINNNEKNGWKFGFHRTRTKLVRARPQWDRINGNEKYVWDSAWQQSQHICSQKAHIYIYIYRFACFHVPRMYSRVIAQIRKYNTRIAVAPLNYIYTNKIKIVTPLAPNKGRKETQRNPKNSNVRRREEKKCKNK